MSEYTKEDLLVLPGEGEKVSDQATIKIRTAELGRDFSVVEGLLEPYELIAPHSHGNEDQAVIVLNGELEFEVGGEGGLRFTAPAGSYVKKPRNVSHSFWNLTDESVRYVELSGRDGFEAFVLETADANLVELQKANEKYAITWYYDRIPELMIQNRLRRLAGVEMPWDKIADGGPGAIVDRLRGLIRGAG